MVNSVQLLGKNNLTRNSSPEMDGAMRIDSKLRTLRSAFYKLAVSSLLLAATTMFGQHRLSKDLNNLSSPDSVDVIIQYQVVPGREHFNRVQSRGGLLKHDLTGMKAGAFRVHG